MSAGIRECRANEVEQVLALWSVAGSAPSVTNSAPHVLAVVEHDDAWLLVAVEDDRIVGTLIAAWDGWRGNFYRLAVLPGHRRRGIASALVEAGEELLREAGAHRLSAIVLHESEGARSFWAAAGYEQQHAVGRFTKTS
jgi:ribosomal protein S18 acetylase RimI-like enzyme